MPSHLFSQPQQPLAVVLEIKSAIGPAAQDFFHRGLKTAIEKNAELVILQLNTPGGLDTAMRGIITEILASPLPIVVYVSPSGARAASAGTYILYAGHIAAMAPGTNIGAATPVSMAMEDKPHNTMAQKAKNDAKAYIRSLAQLRHRNSEWAEKAITQSATLSEKEAMNMHVIEFIAKDIPTLLNKLNNYAVVVQEKTKNLQTQNILVERIQPDWRNQFLNIITDPNIAYILMIIGMWGIFFEFANPGFVLPGVIGGICLLIAMYALQLLPINYVGLALIFLGISFIIAEVLLMSFGVLGIGGIIAFVIGSIMLFQEGTGVKVALSLILSMGIITALFFLLIVQLIIRAQSKPVVSGKEGLIGLEGSVTIDDHGIPRIRIHGELWQVRAITPLTQGKKVKVLSIEGLILLVEPTSLKKS